MTTPKIITVKSTLPPGHVALWEKHPDQPNGEVFVTADGLPHQVAETAAVTDALKRGVLELVNPIQDLPPSEAADKPSRRRKAA